MFFFNYIVKFDPSAVLNNILVPPVPVMHIKTLRSFIFHENTLIFRTGCCTWWCPVHMRASPIGRSEVLQTEPVPEKCYGMVNW